MSTDTPDSLPLSVEVPAWGERSTNVSIAVTGKVNGLLDVCAMGADDVFVEGNLTYRGHGYQVKYIHTNDDGQPKGYWYARDDAERAKASNGQVHGVLPQDGTADWALADVFSPRAPKTFVQPLLNAVADTVKRYLAEHALHAYASRRNSLRQDLNRKATSYNTKAKEAAEALVEYEATKALYDAQTTAVTTVTSA